MTVSGGTLTVNGDLTITDTFDWNAGLLTGGGATVIDDGAVMNIGGAEVHTAETHTIRGDGTVEWSEGSIEAGSLTILADLNITGAAPKSLKRTLNLGGTTTWTGAGDLSLYSGASLNNQAGAVFVVQDDANIHRVSGVPSFNNSGTLEVQAGTLVFEEFVLSTWNTGSTITGPGFVEVGGYVDVAGPGVTAKNVRLNGGTLTVNHDLTITGTFDWTSSEWTSGTLTGGGATVLDSGAVMNIGGEGRHTAGTHTIRGDGTVEWSEGSIYGGPLTLLADLNIAGSADKRLGGTLNLEGTTTWTSAGDLFMDNGSFLNNQAGAIFAVQSDASIRRGGGATNRAFNNNGTLDVQAGTLLVEEFVSFNWNTDSTITGPGFVEVVGQVDVAGPGVTANNVRLDGVRSRMDVNHDLTITGVFDWARGTLTGAGVTLFESGAMMNIGNAGEHTAGNHTIRGDGTVEWNSGRIAGGPLTILADLNIAGPAAKSLFGTLNLGGTTTWTGVGDLALDGGSVLNNQAGAVFAVQSDASIRKGGGAGFATFNNAGTFQKLGSGNISDALVTFNSTGTIELFSGELEFTSIQIDDGHYFMSRPGATLGITTDFAGTTQNDRQFAAQGRLLLDGARSAAAPQLLEVMGTDRGPVTSGFLDNFTHGVLELNSTYAQLTDHADNHAADDNPEALYVDVLIVGAGSTLDLNGLNVYARVARIDGTIVAGTVEILPAGGQILLDTPTSANLQTSGQVDEWTFFGRSGNAVTVMSDPTLPLASFLGQLSVEILAPDSQVLASGESSAAGMAVTLNQVNLPVDGTYRVRVRAASGDPTATGSYLLTIGNATLDVRPLVLNQRELGVLESLYSQDQWTFSAPAGQSVRFDLLGADVAGLRFQLNGPGGWTGFADQTADTDPITLPADGQYVLEADSGGLDTGSYAFCLKEISLTELTLGTTHVGAFTGSSQAQLFHLTLPEQNNLIVLLDDTSDANRNELYVRRGSPPTRSDYNYRFDAMASADQEILASVVAPGDWYILVYSEATLEPGDYSLLVTTENIFIEQVTPDHHGDGQDAVLTLTGLGFGADTTVELVAGDGSTYGGALAEIITPTRLSATFAAGDVPLGVYSIRVTDGGSEFAILADAFTMVAGGEAVLETDMTLPAALGNSAFATFYVEYANTGTASMPAPLLVLNADDAIMTLDREHATKHYFGVQYSTLQYGFTDTIQILASGATPGLLQPGESVRVPVYTVGFLQPWGMIARPFQLSVVTADDDTHGKWSQIVKPFRPSTMTAQAWSLVSDNLWEQLGSHFVIPPGSGGFDLVISWGSYVAMLGENARYLGQLGLEVNDVADLWWFEVYQGYGFHQLSLLEDVTDPRLASPGLSLASQLYYSGCILGRREVTSFGRGWFDSWQTAYREEADGSIVITTPRGFPRRFTPDRRGGFIAQPGDSATLSDTATGYLLRESDGALTAYDDLGRLDYWEDTNGNRITAGYSDERLASLTHSSGQSLRLAYNGEGFVESLTDSDGRVTEFTYTGDYLTSITTPDGMTTTYVYATRGTMQQHHALIEVHGPAGSVFFTYDEQGRLLSETWEGGALPITYSYDTTGRVSVTDPRGSTTQFYYDHRGRLAAEKDPLGALTYYSYDYDGRPVGVTDAFGQQYTSSYDAGGNIIRSADPLGNIVSFDYAGPFDSMSSATDAAGNLTGYGYDSQGNLTSVTQTDSTYEEFTYDTLGNLTAATNRRGDSVDYAYDDAGRIVSKTYPDGATEEFDYDTVSGNLLTVTDTSGITSMEYASPHGDDLLSKITYPSGRFLQYTYDSAGRRTRMVDQDGHEVNYGYGSLGRLEALTAADATPIAAYAYGSAGSLSRKDLANGTWSTYEYDAVGRLIRLVNYASDASINSFFEYAYDEVLLRTSMNSQDGLWTYVFDPVGRLTSAVFESADPGRVADQNLVYEYDAMGNRIRTIRNGVTTDYQSNNLNQYQTVGSETYSYDADGNLVQKTDGQQTTTYTYNAENRLVGVDSPLGSWVYQYDVFGNRIATTHDGVRTEYVVDPFGYGDVVGQYADGGSASVYTYGVGGLTGRVDADGSAFFFDTDELGTVVGLSNAAGVYENSYVFDPFGEILSQSGSLDNPFQFTGAHGIMADGNGLHYMRNRFYDAQDGRFGSTDPIGQPSEGLYTYVENNPLQFIDPLGLRAGHKKESFVTRARREHRDRMRQDKDDFSISKPLRDAVRKVRKPEPPRVRSRTVCMCVRGDFGPGGFGFGVGDGQPFGTPNGPDNQSPNTPEAPTPEPEGDPRNDGLLKIIRSGDPNQKLGPAGFGDEGFLKPGAIFSYRVDFENESDATAPAQRVDVTDQLSADLDWATLEFTEAGFGDVMIGIPVGRQFFRTTVDMHYNNRDFEVDVELAFRSETGRIHVSFQSIDPATSLPPDVLTGFLPPEDGTGRGMGYFSYIIDPLPDLASGTEIRNVALITFDRAETIATNQIDPHDPSQGTDPALEALNTIDALRPTSRVNGLPANSPARFDVTWVGADDDGSGVRSFDLFVSVDAKPFQLWLDDTTATSSVYLGQFGHSYSFYSVATDNVGHVEAVPQKADTQTTIEPAEVVGRHVFYNNSTFDGNDPAANAQDHAAIAPDKAALLPGQTPTLANYTSYSRGINGIMVDIAGLVDPDNLDADDFQFRVGNINDPQSWQPTPPATRIDVRTGAGQRGSDRVSLIWQEGAVTGGWLEMTVLPDNTGLAEPDVFYFANMPGDANGDGATDLSDFNLWNAAKFTQVELDAAADFDRSGAVDLSDFNLWNAHKFTSLATAADPTPPNIIGQDEDDPTEAIDELAWLRELAQSRSKRSSDASTLAAQAVDRLLATYWE